MNTPFDCPFRANIPANHARFPGRCPGLGYYAPLGRASQNIYTPTIPQQQPNTTQKIKPSSSKTSLTRTTKTPTGCTIKAQGNALGLPHQPTIQAL
ncbi:MAG: hypothetical protein IPM61_02465 [Chlorobi bacterium]|nr:hypothetical protein [Chlorobiota bacterium]